ncbi:regulatory protein, luxR family [Duganella sp. CF402]|uniref:helix-turn-helix transcriptional regulator n=1 Tax=unclassified Duganella TaxID=2636909 RepID=UPI0008D0E2FF|nr:MULTISPECIES: helix-turn-helix transcriptional regulator [unclassified Duganella]RZT11259.1 LuxR family transcriptional regulator [Duganella sp. BK701]SEK73853.1 regulatory protein, luxR family [Duganella sp. CF402]
MEGYTRAILELYGSAQECTPGEFSEHTMHLMQRVLPFDSGASVQAEFADGGQMVVRSMLAFNQPLDKLRDRSGLTEPDPILVKAFNQRGRSICVAVDGMDQHKHHEVITYARKYEVEQSLVYIPAAAPAQEPGLIVFWRADTRRPYTQADLALADMIMPHIFQARRINNRLASSAQRQHQALLLISDLQGCLQFSDDGANRMLQTEWPQWTPPELPPAFFRSLRDSSNGHYTGRTLAASISVHGRHVHILLERRSPSAQLTPAELSIARLAVTGATYKQIAAELHLSPATVRNQLHRIYTKLGISNKTALAGRLNQPA